MRKALRYILILSYCRRINHRVEALVQLYFVPNTFAQDDGTQVARHRKRSDGY